MTPRQHYKHVASYDRVFQMLMITHGNDVDADIYHVQVILTVSQASHLS